ncbi:MULTISPECIES: hypothetical protein [unclassified Variovorax]|uniref:hypothetical protein n=1 Tax=unclassified Variovorax TaxID=663243 RepID=UPI001BD5FF3E|nr:MULTISPECIES: hypothetical protein [unclassified Variovorax]
MDLATQEAILEAANGSSEGRLHLGQVIGLLMQAGVESYIAAILFLFSTAVAAQTANCTPDRDGRMVCPQPNASCLSDRLGDVVCSRPGGGIAVDRYGVAACGPGVCVADAEGVLYCSGSPQGAASVGRDGKAVCTGTCVAASAQACVKPVAAN